MTESPESTVDNLPSWCVRPWWGPGVALGLIAALAAGLIAQERLAAQGSHRAEVLVRLRAEETDAARQRHMGPPLH